MTAEHLFSFMVSLVNFAVLLWLLNLVVYQPMLRVVREREENVRKRLDEIDSIKAEAEALREQYQRKAATVEAARQEVLEAAHAEAARLVRRIQDEAERESRYLLSRAEEEGRIEREKAMARLRAQVAEETVERARQILAAGLDAVAREKIMQSFLEKVGERRAG
ncbi:MAG TPA: ATP synthase F0 subunit B [Candidatus Nitrosotenuis sp.]|jgi:F-type H+-transporting ATPase subunit b|nr:ATP synthase F0 subunit B [Candidatus Nitrosotenuis sp.]